MPDSSSKDFSLISLFFFCICNLAVVQNILPRQHLKSISSFPNSVCPETFRIFVAVMLPSKVFHERYLEENFINFVMWRFACMV